MLDTIAISLPERSFRIKHQDRFTPHAVTIMHPTFTTRNFCKATYNPTKVEREKGYHPRLTLIRRAYGSARGIWLKIEFSAPKLLFGNNFEEISAIQELSTVIDLLLKRLQSMGIETTKAALRAAQVNAIHYSKNILLERETPTYLLIQALEKLDLSQQLDLTQTDFRNSGQMVKYHASGYEIALYDKVKDLEQVSKYGEKRGIENDYCDMPMLCQHLRKPEVLRFEIRLGTRKLKSLLKTLNIEHDNTLTSLFSADISRAVLLHYWGIITQSLYLMNINTSDTERLIYAARKAFPRKQIGKIMELLYFVHACQKLGVRGARMALCLKPHQWYRLKRDAKELNNDAICPRFSILSGIKNQLIDSIPLVKADIVDNKLLTG
jgi:hypothetical protein